MAAVVRPPCGCAAVDRIADRRVGTEVEQRLDRLDLAALRRKMEGGDALTVVGTAEGSATVHVGTELDEKADRSDAPVHRRPVERRATVGIGVDIAAEIDEPLDRLESFALGCPDERLVKDLLRIVGRLPGRKGSVRAVEATVCAGGGCA